MTTTKPMNFVLKKLILKEATLYVALYDNYLSFLNNLYCLFKLSPYNIFEKLDVIMQEIDTCIIVLVSSNIFRVYTKNVNNIVIYHNTQKYNINNSIIIHNITHDFSIYCNNKIILSSIEMVSSKEAYKNNGIFAYININNACKNEKNTQNSIVELIKVKEMIERLLSFYNCEIANTDLEYIIVRFDDPLRLIHFIDKLSAILDSVCLSTLNGSWEKLVYSIGLSYGMYAKLYDHASTSKYSYCGIALNLCARLAKLCENKVLMCNSFYRIVNEQLKYLNYDVTNMGKQYLKGFDMQDVYVLTKRVYD